MAVFLVPARPKSHFAGGASLPRLFLSGRLFQQARSTLFQRILDGPGPSLELAPFETVDAREGNKGPLYDGVAEGFIEGLCLDVINLLRVHYIVITIICSKV